MTPVWVHRSDVSFDQGCWAVALRVACIQRAESASTRAANQVNSQWTTSRKCQGGPSVEQPILVRPDVLIWSPTSVNSSASTNEPESSMKRTELVPVEVKRETRPCWLSLDELRVISVRPAIGSWAASAASLGRRPGRGNPSRTEHIPTTRPARRHSGRSHRVWTYPACPAWPGAAHRPKPRKSCKGQCAPTATNPTRSSKPATDICEWPIVRIRLTLPRGEGSFNPRCEALYLSEMKQFMITDPAESQKRRKRGRQCEPGRFGVRGLAVRPEGE